MKIYESHFIFPKVGLPILISKTDWEYTTNLLKCLQFDVDITIRGKVV